MATSVAGATPGMLQSQQIWHAWWRRRRSSPRRTWLCAQRRSRGRTRRHGHVRRRRRWRRWWPPQVDRVVYGRHSASCDRAHAYVRGTERPRSQPWNCCAYRRRRWRWRWRRWLVIAVLRELGWALVLAGLGCASAALSFQRNRFSRALHACDDHHEGLPLGQREANAAAAEQPLRCLSIARWHDVTLEQRFSAAVQALLQHRTLPDGGVSVLHRPEVV